MAPPLAVLPQQRLDPYGPSVPRPPKNFRITSVSIEPLQPEAYLSTGADTAVPTRFEAHFALHTPEASVTIEVLVTADQGPMVLDLAIRAKARTPITTSMLRQVLVDQLLQRAVEEATVPAAVRTEWLASATGGNRALVHEAEAPSKPRPPADERTRLQFDADAATAAKLWSDAKASGSNAPGLAVARGMNRSRAQVARYIRRARELELLPPASNEKS